MVLDIDCHLFITWLVDVSSDKDITDCENSAYFKKA